MAENYIIQSISDFDNFNKPYHVIELLPLKEMLDKDYHRHDYYEIMLFEKGSGEHIIDFNSFKIENHSVHFVLPGQVHKLKRTAKSNGYAILFSEDLVVNGKDSSENIIFDLPFYNNTLPCCLSFSKEEYHELVYLSEKLRKEESGKNESDTVAGLYLNLMLSLLHRICSKHSGQVSEETNNKTALLIKFKRLLEKNFASGMKPGNYSAALNISTGHLNDILKEAYQKTTGELLQERVVLESKRLLFHTDLTVNEIAFKLGFEDPGYFARLFRKHTDSTPKDYRISSRKKSA